MRVVLREHSAGNAFVQPRLGVADHPTGPVALASPEHADHGRAARPEVPILRVREVCEGVAKMTGAKVDLVYERGYPVTKNHADQTDFATQVAREVAGAQNVHEMPPLMGAEDFAYMLEARPGAFIFCGNGDSAGLHHPAYDFNDEAIVYGTSYWIKLVENKLAAA